MNDTAPVEAVIGLTASAVQEVKNLLTRPENVGKVLRVYVEKGGCSGMQYGLIFDEKRDGDLTVEQDGVIALVDAFSADYLRGSVVDFSDALRTAQRDDESIDTVARGQVSELSHVQAIVTL